MASTSLDIFETVLSGVGQYLGLQIPSLILFGFIFQFFAILLLALLTWKIR